MKKEIINIIIVVFNSEKYIEKCIDSIISSDIDKFEKNIVIIDNFSDDNSVKIVKKIQNKYHKIVLFENKKNVGFAKAVNQGIKTSIKSDYFLLLNPDTVLNRQSIPNLLKCLKANKAGICSGTTINLQGKITESFYRLPSLLIGIFDFTNLRKLCKNDKWHNYFYYLDKEQTNKDSFPVEGVTGGFMLINNNTINKLGLFDESYFMYLEDVDYCYRAIKKGIRIFHTNTSRIVHIGGASSSNKNRIRHYSWLKSRKIYFLKHFGILENIIIQPIFLLDDILILIKKSISKNNTNQSHLYLKK